MLGLGVHAPSEREREREKKETDRQTDRRSVCLKGDQANSNLAKDGKGSVTSQEF